MFCNIARAESTLPKCEGSDFNWTNCFGTTDYQVGDQYGTYEGEWKDGERHGQGTYDAFKCKNPLRNSKRLEDMIVKLKKEDKIKLFKLKDMNYEPIKPVNPHK